MKTFPQLSRWAIFLICVLTTHTVRAERENHSDSIAIHNEISGIQYPDIDSREDSLIRALYPEVRECHYVDSLNSEELSAKTTTVRNSLPGRDGIFNPAVPNIVTIDKSKTVGEIEIRSSVEHRRSNSPRVNLKFEVVKEHVGLSHLGARIQEQIFINMDLVNSEEIYLTNATRLLRSSGVNME